MPERELTLVCRRTVGEDVALLHRVALADQRLLVDAGALVRTPELGEAVRHATVGLVVDGDGVAGDVDDRAVVLREQRVARVACGAASTPVPMYGAVARRSGTA